MDTEIKLKISGALLILESIFLVYSSLTPGIPLVGEQIFSFEDTILHFVAYFAYGILAEKTLKLGGKENTIIMALIIGSAFGAFTEILQAFTPLRSASLADWAADIIGSGVGGYISFKKLKHV